VSRWPANWTARDRARAGRSPRPRSSNRRGDRDRWSPARRERSGRVTRGRAPPASRGEPSRHACCAARITRSDDTALPSLRSRRSPSGASRNHLSERDRSSPGGPQGAPARTERLTSSVPRASAAAIPLATFACSVPRSCNAARDSRTESRYDNPPTRPTDANTASKRPQVRARGAEWSNRSLRCFTRLSGR